MERSQRDRFCYGDNPVLQTIKRIKHEKEISNDTV